MLYAPVGTLIPVKPQVQRLPTHPAPFHQLLRGPTRRWWRPVLALLVFVPLLLIGAVLAEIIAVGFRLLRGENPLEGPAVNLSSASSFLELNLILIAALPAAVLSIWVAHRIRPGYASSVAGRIRWRWLARSLMIIGPIWVLYMTVTAVVGLATGAPITARPADWVTLMILVLLTTPFQAAAEEYVFRGWLTQNLGMYFSSERLGLIVTTLVSAALFALAHGSLDPWIIADLMVFASAASLLAWRTGGLEASIVLHAVNNILAFGVVLIFGGWEEAFVDTTSTGSPISVGISLVFNAAVLALVWRWTGRHRLVRTYPAAVAEVTSAG